MVHEIEVHHLALTCPRQVHSLLVGHIGLTSPPHAIQQFLKALVPYFRQHFEQKLASYVRQRTAPHATNAGVSHFHHIVRAVQQGQRGGSLLEDCQQLLPHSALLPGNHPLKLVLIGRRLIEHCALRLDILYFLDYEVDEDLSWHSAISRIRRKFVEHLFNPIFGQSVVAGLVAGDTQIVHTAPVKANASLHRLCEKQPIKALVPRLHPTDEATRQAPALPSAATRQAQQQMEYLEASRLGRAWSATKRTSLPPQDLIADTNHSYGVNYALLEQRGITPWIPVFGRQRPPTGCYNHRGCYRAYQRQVLSELLEACMFKRGRSYTLRALAVSKLGCQCVFKGPATLTG